VEADVFLHEAGAAFMGKAENPQPALLRISNDAARELLARGDADVYALTNNGEKRLEAFEALRPLCFAEYKETAIKKEALPGLDKWAERKVKDINREAEREERSKSKDKEEL
jgi:DNA-binding PadR family transcriptional regulator